MEEYTKDNHYKWDVNNKLKGFQCTDYDTGKAYKKHKWREDYCDCPTCTCGERFICERCYEDKE